MLHSLRWISPALRHLVAPRSRRKPSTVRPRLEALEDRTVPATIRVNSLLDTASPDANLTLREAVDILNAGNTGGRSAEEIAQVTGNLGTNDVIELNLAGTITLGQGRNFTIARSCTINHTGSELTIQGNSAGVFVINSSAGNVTINGGASGLTLDGGSVNHCIANAASLTLDRLTIRNGLSNLNGGGIANSGNLTVTSSTFFSNVSAERGGAIYNGGNGVLSVVGCTFEANLASDGGAIFTERGATISASTFSGNQALDSPSSGVVGAAIRHTSFQNPLLVDGCTFVNNRATNTGGAAIFSTGGELTTVRKSILTGNTRAGGVLSDLAADSEFTRDQVNGNVLSQFNPPPGTTLKNNLLNVSSSTAFGPVPALAFNGGPTRTFAPIRDVASSKNSTPSRTPVPDQRGGPFGPIGGGARDPGAVEFTRELTVDTLTDVVDGNYLSGQFSLREAIGIANADPGPNRISFDPNLSGTIRLTNGELFITGSSAPTNIIGPGADKLTIDAQGNSRVLQIDFGAVAEVVGLTLTKGKASAGLPLEGGGAILNRGFLDMTDVLVTSSTVDSANGGGGGIFNTPAATLLLNRVGIHGNTASKSFGGGLLNEGTATITSSSIAGNTVTAAGPGVGAGGGIDNGGTLTVTNSSVLSNSATESGGGILNAGTITLLNTTVAGNRAFLGAGIYTEDFAQPPFAVTTLTNSLVAGNTFSIAPTPNDLGGKNVATASKNNLIGDANSAGGLAQGTNGNIVGVADLTTVLAFSGGNLQSLKNGALETLSIALVENVNNPAIDAGDDAAAAALDRDQSNIRARKIGSRVDIGAFEQSFAAPTVVKSVDPDLTFEVQFDESVTGVDASDFRLVTTGGATAAITNVTGGGDRYFVTVQVTGSGQVTLNVADNNSIVDAVIKPLGGPTAGDGDFTGTPETIDQTAPALPVANIDDGDADNQIDVGTKLVYTLTFSEDLDATSVTAADFDSAGTATVTIDVAAETEPGVVRVLVTPTTVGSVILRIPTGAVVRDVAGNSLVVPVQDADTVQALAVPINLVVDTTGDVDDGNVSAGQLSLREAVRIANEQPGFNTITFAPGIASITLTNELVVNDSTSINGSNRPAGVTLDGGPGTNRIFDIGAGVQFQLTRLTLTGGNGTGANLTDRGGAVNSQGSLVINDCTFDGNSAPFGGAIHSYNQGTMAVRNSTFRNNTASTFGGAILDNGTDAAPSSLTQCTFTDNSSGTGGAVFNFSTITMTQCTVAGNDGGGGIVGSFTSVLTLVNSIVSDNAGDDVRLTNGASLTRQGVNIIRSFTLTNGTQSGPAALSVDPLLGPLASNGGPTRTMALLAGSPAINAGTNASVPADLTTDQRGFARIQSTAVDLGAFELFIAPPPPPPPPLAAVAAARVRRLRARLLNKKSSRKSRKQIRFVQITSDDGSLELELRLQYQDSAGFKGIAVAVRSEGGVDQVVATAKKGKRLFETVLL